MLAHLRCGAEVSLDCVLVSAFPPGALAAASIAFFVTVGMGRGRALEERAVSCGGSSGSGGAVDCGLLGLEPADTVRDEAEDLLFSLDTFLLE